VKEITDKEIIKKIALTIRNAKRVSEPPNFNNGKYYDYHFVIRDSNGIGKIAYRYFAQMQDISFEGYIRAGGDIYKLDAEFNKLITKPFGSIISLYDEKLGGKQQMYEAFISSCKIIFRKLIKEGPSIKSEITLLNQGQNIWQNGSQVKDNLKGKYKLQVIMKDTTVQKKVVEQAKEDIARMPGVVDIIFTEGCAPDTLVVYICFDSKPVYDIGESEDSLSFVISSER